MEHWKEIPMSKYRDLYKISDDGRVYSVRKNKILKPVQTVAGYYRVSLAYKGSVVKVPIHRLVALAFIPNPENKPTVNHKNEVKTDNNVTNLEWATMAEQNVHGTRIERAVSHTDYKARNLNYQQIAQKHDYMRQDMCNRKPTKVIKDGQEWVFNTQREASVFSGVSVSRVSACVSGQVPSCKGYTFRSAT